MKNFIDKQYILLQFQVKVHQKNGSEFQGFFEDIMQKAFSTDFKKIRPYGNLGDGGNDGYIPSKGFYYQVYAPMNPNEKDVDAAEKFKNNFNTLKNKWSEISKIKAYNFVFNDKYHGSSIELERAAAELKNDNPNIEFNIFRAIDIEKIFTGLNNDQLISLGFDVDSRNALKISREYLQKLELEFDRGNISFASKALEAMRGVIAEQGDESLKLDFEIMEGRILQRLEKVDEAEEKYKSIYKRHPKDTRAPLYLAEIYLNAENYDENERLLNEVKAIDSSYWLYPLEVIIRNYRLGTLVDAQKIDEKSFPDDPRIKADYYRLYSLYFERPGNFKEAEAFIEQAIKLNPEKFSNYEVKLAFIEQELFSTKDIIKRGAAAQQLLVEIEVVYEKFKALGGMGIRNQILLNIKRVNAFLIQENYLDSAIGAKETFELVLQCYFDQLIDKVLAGLLPFTELSDEDFEKLLTYLNKSRKKISDNLAKAIFLQFLYRNTPTHDIKSFFTKAKKEKIVEFVDNIETSNYDGLKPTLDQDINFAVSICVLAKSNPQLRKKIIEFLPDDGSINKEKLLLLFHLDEGSIDEAFLIIKKFDLSKLSYIECRPALEVAEKKKAWDFVVVLLEKLLQHEKTPKQILQIKLRLFTANLNLERFSEVTRIGGGILENEAEITMLDEENQEIVTAQTAQSWLRRGKYPEAKKFIEKYASYLKKFEAKVFLESEIYIKNKMPEAALKAVVDGIKSLKRPSPEEYGSLFLAFSEIGNLMDFQLVSMEKVELGSFVKFKDEEKWFFIGDNDELDAIKILPANQEEFIGKTIGEKIKGTSKYRSEQAERKIENILPIEKYILWQSIHNAQKLSLDGAWDKMEVIEVPQTANGIDPKYLIAKLQDLNERGREFFDTYCEQNIPLALLAVSQGSLPNAIGKIINEQRGFIKSSTGTQQEIDEQKQIASEIINGQAFYLDGTSALVLSETGLLEKIYKHLPNLKVPQSVISLLLEVKEKFAYLPGTVGHMHYAQGKIGMSNIDQVKRESIENNFKKSIEILESKPNNIEVISSANKSPVFSEQKIFPSLVDACILAQRDDLHILTEDFLYLQMNELETKKNKPKYCSSLELVRVLYEQNKISFEEYLNFFSYLSSYRFKFLPITTEDLEKAILGDGIIKIVKVDNLKKFNFPLTLSEEYGVPLRTSATLIVQFLAKLLKDDSVTPEIIKNIFAEIIETFPIKKDRKLLGRSLIAVSVQMINKGVNIVYNPNVQEKINTLLQFIEMYCPGGIIKPCL
jgi:hypothetical protein